MTKFKYFVFFLTLIMSLLLSLDANAQIDVTVSKDVVELNGKEFYVHTVKKGQTIYSISKAYSIDVTEIYRYNPESRNLIRVGQTLNIPKNDSKSAVKKPDEKPPIKDSNFVYHKVSPGETIYRITQIYGLKEEVLYDYNKGLTSNIYPGQWIKIPQHEKVASDKTKESYEGNVFEYEIKPKDNFYQLKKRFFVSKEQLEILNPELKNRGLQIGMKILIPKLDKFEEKGIDFDFIPEIEIDTNIQKLVDNHVFTTPCDSLGRDKEKFKIGLLIPLHTEYLNNIVVSDNGYNVKDETEYPSFEYIHFYEGFLIAADSMAKLGLNIELFVYDTKNDTSEVRRITENKEFGELDIIFGPFSIEGVKIIADETKGTETKVVSPISLDAGLTKNNSHLFATIPTPFEEINGMVEYVNDSLNNANFIVIHNNKRNELYALRYIRNIYWKYAATKNLDTNNFYIESYVNNGVTKLNSILDKTKPNVIINLVDNEAYISNFIRNLYKKTDVCKIYLVGTERRWNNYKTLEEKYLVALNLLLVNRSFVEYDNYFVKNFIKKFREEYNTDPNMLAYQGYDLAWHFLNALGFYGTQFQACINGLNLNTLQSKYLFEYNYPDAWQNTYVNIYQYDNYKLIDKKRPLQEEKPKPYSQIGVIPKNDEKEEKTNQ